MTRDEGHVVTEGPQAFTDGANESVVIAAREVGPSDGATEKDVSDEGQAVGAVEEHDMARCMPRTMQHFKRDISDPNRVPLVEPPSRRKATRGPKSEHEALLRHGIDPEAILGMRSLDRKLELVCQVCRGARMVNMAVGEEDLLELNARSLHGREYERQIAPRVDHGRPPCFATPDQRAILLEWSNWNDLKLKHVEPIQKVIIFSSFRWEGRDWSGIGLVQCVATRQHRTSALAHLFGHGAA